MTNPHVYRDKLKKLVGLDNIVTLHIDGVADVIGKVRKVEPDYCDISEERGHDKMITTRIALEDIRGIAQEVWDLERCK